MPDFMMQQTARPVSASDVRRRDRSGSGTLWQRQRERLDYRIWRWSLGTVEFPSLVLATSPFNVDEAITPPVIDAFQDSCELVVVPAMTVAHDLPLLRFCDGAVRYAVRHGDRHVVDLSGSFDDYLKRFSKKSRGNLQRSVRKLSEPVTETSDLRVYETVQQIMAFRELAIAISRRSYKQSAGIGFSESHEFAARLQDDADRGALRGYVLFYGGRPAAYALCRIEGDVITYKQIGYVQELAQQSPGTSLLYLLIKHLFDESRFRLLDFDALEHYSYKAYFGTRSIRCARVLWFKPTLRNLSLIALHCVALLIWQGASHVLRCLRNCSRAGSQVLMRLRS